jgi:site-specific recombinase XerD
MARWGIFDVNIWHTVLSSVAPSTKRAYERIFFDFVSLVDENGFTFNTVKIELLLSFLQKFVGLSTSRIRSAVAALKFFLRVYNRLDLADHPLLTMFSKGAQNLAPLPKAKPTVWNPETVLNDLKIRPRPSDFLSCAKEALILLLLSTGWRVDDVWKLDRKVDVSSENANFFFREKRKCKVRGRHSLSRLIPRFHECQRICPVLAIEKFLVCAQRIRKNESFLFVSSLGLRASKDTLRRWVTDVLSRCGISASAGSCRSAATSSALERNWPVDEIMKSAGWSSESTFRRYYDRQVLSVAPALNLLASK